MNYLNKSKMDDEENIDVLELLFDVELLFKLLPVALLLLFAWLFDLLELLLVLLFRFSEAVEKRDEVDWFELDFGWLFDVAEAEGLEDEITEDAFCDIAENAAAAIFALAWALEAIVLTFLYCVEGK